MNSLIGTSTKSRILPGIQAFLKRVGSALLLFVVCQTAKAQWPVELRWSGVPLGYPKIEADGENGAFVAGSGLAFDGWDTFLFHVDSAGNSLWEVADSACYIAPGNQYPIAMYPDGTGGCVALIDEEVLNFPEPSRNRVQIIRYDAEGHKVWQYMPYDTTWEDSHIFGTLAASHGQVDIFWYNAIPDSLGGWMTRLNVSDGMPLDSPAVRYFGRHSPGQAFERNDTLFLRARDTVFVMDYSSGVVDTFRSLGTHLYSQRMLLRGDSILVAGLVSSNGLSPWVLRCLYDETERNDTVGSNIVSLRMNMVFHGDTLLLSYARNIDQINRYDLFGRLYLPGTGLGEEFVICDERDYQSDLRTVEGSQGIGLAWSDLREAAYVYIQQYRNGQWRWPSGFRLAPIEVSPNAQMDACGGGEFGYVVWGDLSSLLRVQPIDSLSIDTVPSSLPLMPSQFILHDPFPNPFNGSVQIQFDLPREGRVTAKVYNVLGEQIAQLANDTYAAGTHKIMWQSDVGSGIYFLRIETSRETQTRKLLLIR